MLFNVVVVVEPIRVKVRKAKATSEIYCEPPGRNQFEYISIHIVEANCSGSGV